MIDRELTVRSRVLGLVLTKAMQAKGMTSGQLAAQLGWSASRLSRLVRGWRGVSRVDLAALLALCGVVGPTRDALLRLAREAWESAADGWLPATPVMVDLLEHNAASLASVDMITLPALLRTEDHQRALLLANPAIPDTEIDQRITQLRTRQHILDRADPASFQFYLDGRALTQTGLRHDVMSDQLHHLLRLCVRPHVNIRIVPAGRTLLRACPPFQYLTFTEPHPVIHLDHPNTTVFLDEHTTLVRYRAILDELDKVALDRERSRSWLVTFLGEPDLPD